MSEEAKKPRTVQDIQGEYQGLCAKAGHLQYQISALSADLKIINDTLKELNLEAFKLAGEAKKKADEEAKTAAEAETKE